MVHENIMRNQFQIKIYWLSQCTSHELRIIQVISWINRLTKHPRQQSLTRLSENDNTPQPLDQWKNSPFIGQQVGNCKFHIDPLLGRSICHAPWPKVNPIMHPTSYPTHIPFIPSESTLPFLSYSNFNILPWKSKVKVKGEVKVWSHNVSLTFYRPTSPSFHVNQPSHSWDMTFSLCIQHHIQLTTLSFQVRTNLPFLSYSNFNILPWKSKVKVTGEVKV